VDHLHLGANQPPRVCRHWRPRDIRQLCEIRVRYVQDIAGALPNLEFEGPVLFRKCLKAIHFNPGAGNRSCVAIDDTAREGVTFPTSVLCWGPFLRERHRRAGEKYAQREEDAETRYRRNDTPRPRLRSLASFAEERLHRRTSRGASGLELTSIVSCD